MRAMIPDRMWRLSLLSVGSSCGREIECRSIAAQAGAFAAEYNRRCVETIGRSFQGRLDAGLKGPRYMWKNMCPTRAAAIARAAFIAALLPLSMSCRARSDAGPAREFRGRPIVLITIDTLRA